MEIEDIPAWMPEPVRRAAAAYWPIHPLMVSLLTAPEMEAVWTYFEAHGVEPDFKERFARGTGLLIPNLYGLDLHWPDTPKSSQALALLFYAMLVAANNTRTLVYSATIDGEVSKLKDTILHVEALRKFAPDPTPLSEEMEHAIAAIVTHCLSNIDLLNYADNPAVLKREGDNDVSRSYIRRVGAATYALYGECSYKNLATVANSMFPSKHPVTKRGVEKWCTDQPLPLKADLNRTTH